MTLDIFENLDVSRETIAKLEHFKDLTLKWTPRINLIAPSTTADIWVRHIVDSAQIYRFAPDEYPLWSDLGSGGGFPGIVLAVLAAEKAPAAQFTMIESDHRKSTFLRTAIRELSLNATVQTDRIENVVGSLADVVTARALAPLEKLLPLLDDHLTPDGAALLHKGRQWQAEISDARQYWDFEVEDHPSMTDPEARILKVSRISRV